MLAQAAGHRSNHAVPLWGRQCVVDLVIWSVELLAFEGRVGSLLPLAFAMQLLTHCDAYS